MTGAFSYPASDHARPAESPAAQPAGTPAAEQPAAPAEPKPFSYPETGKPLPEGAPLDTVPQAVRELREADDARKVFSPQLTYKEAIPAQDHWREENKAAAAEFREIAADVGLSVDEAGELTKIATGLTELPTDETKAEWEAQAWDQLRREHGEQGAKQALADAQRLIARDPRLVQFLAQTGLGSHPQFVRVAVAKARGKF